MAVRSRRIAGPQRLTNVVAAIYTVPSGRTAVVRRTWLQNISDSASAKVTLRINATTGATVILDRTLAAGEGLRLEEMVLNPGDVLYGRTGGATQQVDCTLFGSLLEGEPV